MVIAAVLIAACSPDEELSLPERRALSDGPQFAVAVPAYSRLHESPDIESAVVGHLRRGDIAGIASESEFTDVRGDDVYRWYEVTADGGDGWVFGRYVSLHDTQAQAERVSMRLAGSREDEEESQ